MKEKIKAFSFILALCAALLTCAAPALAEAAVPSTQNVGVEIVSPSEISSKPIYEGDIEIKVVNNGAKALDNLACYLTIVDVERKQTYPVDEFGENAHQTRSLTLKPGEAATVKIPVRILYVGNFRFTASVIDFASGRVYGGDALDVQILTDSKMNKTLVMVTAGIVPVAVIAVTAVIGNKRKNKKI